MSLEVWTYTLLSVFGISLISFVGLLTLLLKVKNLNKFLIYMVSFAAGALIGDAFIHLLPGVVAEVGFTPWISLLVILGIVSMFIIEKFIHWHHCHTDPKHCRDDEGTETYATMNLIGDGVHNFIDGIIIATSYLVSMPIGLATTVAVVLHEIPQEIGDFGVLVHGGFSKNKALLFNFLSALGAVVGAIITLLTVSVTEGLTNLLIPLAAGHFIYIAVADLLPELHKEKEWDKSLLQLMFFLLGIAIMFVLLYLE